MENTFKGTVSKSFDARPYRTLKIRADEIVRMEMQIRI
jgi:hypothetical protein